MALEINPEDLANWPMDASPMTNDQVTEQTKIMSANQENNDRLSYVTVEQVAVKAAERVEYTGIEMEPLVGGDTEATALVVPNGPAGEQRTADVSSGKWYDFGSGPVQASADKRWKAYWNGTSWALKDMGALPQPIGKDSFDPEGTDIPNERAIAGYVEPMMSLLEPSTNLADNDKMVAGAYILADGSFVVSNNSISLPKQKIKEGEEVISISGAGGLASSFARFTFYDEEGSYISGSRDSTGVPIPEGTNEFGVTVDNTTGVGLDPTNSPFKGTLMVNYGAPLPYEPFSKKISSRDIINETFVEKEDLEIDATYGKINLPTSTNTSYLVLNAPLPVSGKVDKITMRTPDTGILKLVLLKKLTSAYPNPVAGNKEMFEPIRTLEFDITTAGINELTVDIDGEIGQYLGIDGRAEEGRNIVRPSWQPSATSEYGWWQKTSTTTYELTFQPIDINLSYHIKSSKYVTQEQLENSKPKEVKYNYIVATKNAENYNSIRNIVKGITNASEFNRYVILVPKGEWFEIDLQGKDFVDIVGEDRDATILYCDGNDTTKIIPDDYYYAPERGKVISTVNLSYLHVVFAIGGTNYTNLTLYQTRGKYAAHLDNVGFGELTFRNVRFKEDGGTSYLVGIGLRGGQKLNFFDCIFERFQYPTSGPIGRLAMFFHNWNNQASGCEMNIINAHSINCGYVLIDELGSEQDDRVNIVNWQTNDIGQMTFMVDVVGGKSLWTNADGVKEPDPRKVPYCISVNMFSTRVDHVIDRLASNFTAPYNTGTQRPEWFNHIISDYYGYAIVDEGVTILKGQVIAYGSAQTSSIAVPVAKPFAGFSDSEILGTALEDSANGKVRYVPKGKYAETLVNGAIGTGDQAKKIVWDDVNKYLKADPTADVRNIQGIALTNKSSGASYGIVKLK